MTQEITMQRKDGRLRPTGWQTAVVWIGLVSVLFGAACSAGSHVDSLTLFNDISAAGEVETADFGAPDDVGLVDLQTTDLGENANNDGGGGPGNGATDGATGGAVGDTQGDVDAGEWVDAEKPEDGNTVLLPVNSDGLATDVSSVDFGSVFLGDIAYRQLKVKNVDSVPITILSFEVIGASGFGAIHGNKDVGANVEHVLDPPLELNPGASWMVIVWAKADLAGLQTADLVVQTLPQNEPDPMKSWTLPMSMNGAAAAFDEGDCPVAIATVEEGDKVIPQTVLHLSGETSYAKVGEVVKWSWAVEQPMGSQSTFLPSSDVKTPTFEANVVGLYQFTLTVTDSLGNDNCLPETVYVVVCGDEAIHVELLWNTPQDKDQQDEGPEAGADLDLHFAHPFAAGPDVDKDTIPDGWFDNPFDCFWFNPNPQWGSFDPVVDDDPSLDRDDTDGAGPENLNLNIPEPGKTYRIGVHYWHDHGFGPSYATVRIYLFSVLVFEMADVKLVHHDLWEVATIEWPTGKIQPVLDAKGKPKIVPKYQNPFFFQP